MTSEIERLGGQFMASSSRETIMYQATTYAHSIDSVVSLLADSTLHPRITAQELDAQRDAAAWEVAEIQTKPDMFLPELLHEVAYRHNTLGNPLLCPEDRLRSLTPETIRGFREGWYSPERIVLAGAGVPHEDLRRLAERHFGQLASTVSPVRAGADRRSTLAATRSTTNNTTAPPPPSLSRFHTSAPESATVVDVPSSIAERALARAQYTGGELYLDHPESEFTHLYVAFEGLSIHDDDIYALATLQVLLGGGGSFSAGSFSGPFLPLRWPA
jgi:mitochondrial-processing peptidase subunit alpha